MAKVTHISISSIAIGSLKQYFPHNDFLNCHVLLLLHTLHYPLLPPVHTKLVFEADSAVSSPIPRCHKFIQTHQSNCHNCCIDFALVHSLIGDYLCLFTRYIHIISMMTINDDTYNRHIRRIVTNYRQTSLQYYSTVPPKDYCVCVLCIVVYTSAYEHPFFVVAYFMGLVDGALPSRQGTSSTESENSWLT